MTYYNRLAVLGDWTFYQVGGYGEDALYAYAHGLTNGEYPPKIGELYLTLEYAMASAIAEKYTGPRGAGGSGVGTAADWFMRSIGAFEPTREELIKKAVRNPQLINAAEDGWGEEPRKVATTVIDALELGRKV